MSRGAAVASVASVAAVAAIDTAKRRKAPPAPTKTGGAPCSPTAPLDGPATARSAGLRYVSDHAPGIRRKRAGRAFSYVAPDGRTVRDADDLARIRKLAIPPAWTDVWICPHANGHIQATGRDAKGRKQYRYHARWRDVRDETKYERMLAFAAALPRIRAETERQLAQPGLRRERVLATVVRLLEMTLIRVGNEEYARKNASYGLTTLRASHVRVDGTHVTFHFRGKSGKDHVIDVDDPRMARIVGRCQAIPGQELFQYFDDAGERQTVESADVNAYLRAVTGEDFTAKDFRTWAGTVLAARELGAVGPSTSATATKRQITAAITRVAARLGNTPTVCRKCYVHPAVLEAYAEGVIVTVAPASASATRGKASARRAVAWSRAGRRQDGADGGLRPDEAAVAAFLARRARHAA